MRYLVTGGAGFIGSHFIHMWLANHPADTVVNLDGLTYAGSAERLADLQGDAGYQFLQGDICEPAAVQQAMDGCQVVVHFAAETHVDRSIANATPFLRTNIEGTHVLLEEARRRRVNRFIHISTDEVYGAVLEGAVDEQAPLAPRSPYAASKAAGDLLAQACFTTYGLPVIVVRPTNIYGPGQFPEKFIPLCMTNGFEGVPIPIYGDGRQRRAWLFVTDICEALQAVVERGRFGAVYNVAGGTELANRDLAQTILSLVGQPHTLMESVADRPGHDRRYAMTDAGIRALGWQPKTTIEQGLSHTLAWYREHRLWWQPLKERLREDPDHWLHRTPGSGARSAARVVP